MKKNHFKKYQSPKNQSCLLENVLYEYLDLIYIVSQYGWKQAQFMKSTTTRVQTLKLFGVLVDSYLVNLLKNLRHPI